MIEGLRVRFTTEQLRAHLTQLIGFWNRQSDRIGCLLEMKGGTLPQERIEHARMHAEASRRTADCYRLIIPQLPEDNVFEFRVQGFGVREIEWPISNEKTDAELEQALFSPPPPNPFADLLRRAGANVPESD